MNQLTEDYLVFQANGGPQRAEASWRATQRLRALFGVEHLARPVYLDRHQVEELDRDLPALYRLLDELPDRLCGGDLASFARLCGATPAQVDAVLATAHPTGWPVGRADLLHTGDGFVAIEMNMAAVGGVDTGELCQAMTAIPDVGEFVAARDLTFTDPGSAFREVLRAELDRIGLGADARIAVVCAPGESPRTRGVFELLALLLEEDGYHAVAGGLDELSYPGGEVHVAGVRVDVVLRFFLLDLVGGEAGDRFVTPLLDACRHDQVVLLAPFSADLAGGKRAFALPWHREHAGDFTSAERELVARFTPWSHVLTEQISTVDGQLVDALEHCAAERPRLVLKGGMSQSGQDVVMGRDLTDGQWRAAVLDGLRRQSVVQRLVEAPAEPFVEGWPPVAAERTVNWGVYVIGERYAGVMARGALSGRSGIVSYDSGALLGCSFEERRTATGAVS
ncbi:hypothetical protein [Lentzea flaviverrucosa]|uniref:Circularly permuted ATP-grasp type 2 n=1 Tax=Lentzea flaviverrucosa TaxID=200379 RepID=A0A1H9WUU7_9PSEU|nr:hypothetical protein [Lentzea flaviverrucosa]RDI23110.1 hypothetical protein DFR72_111241 [Lentzea flaviverrucosa]SES37467.1 hypothetical protein SAMN05216195_112235 [Lentzea flaviverrucosa]